MTPNMSRCVETTLVSCVMCINAILPLPAWVIVFCLLCLVWVWLPDDIEIHI